MPARVCREGHPNRVTKLNLHVNGGPRLYVQALVLAVCTAFAREGSALAGHDLQKNLIRSGASPACARSIDQFQERGAELHSRFPDFLG